MLKNRKLIGDTLSIMARLKIAVNEDVLRILKLSLSKESERKDVGTDIDYCELPMSSDEVSQLVDVLFDAETDFAPKGLGSGSEEDECRGREANKSRKNH